MNKYMCKSHAIDAYKTCQGIVGPIAAFDLDSGEWL